MKIKYIKAKNFLSIGENPVELDFTKFGNIVNIKGKNLDAGIGCSNGSGKTTISEIIVYALYGKLIKGLNHKEAINVKSKKGLEVEIHWDDYKVIRRREPNRLQIFQGDKDITPGKAIDDFIKNKIGLDYNSFVNVACFGQHNVKPFLSCDPSEKRKIAENLLSLDRYLIYHDVAKKKLKGLQGKIDQLSTLYNTSIQEVSSINKKQVLLTGQQQNWIFNKKKEIYDSEKEIITLQKSIENVRVRDDFKEYESKQKELLEVESQVEKKDKIRTDLYVILEKADVAIRQRKEEKQELLMELSNCERELCILGKEIKSFQEASEEFKNKRGVCTVCFGEITEKNVVACIEHNLQKIKERQVKHSEITKKKLDIDVKVRSSDINLSKLLEARKLAKEKEITVIEDLNVLLSRRRELLKIKKPEVSSEIALLEKDLTHVRDKKNRLTKEFEDGSPYDDMIKVIKGDLQSAEEQTIKYKSELKSNEMDIPYCNFWVKGFSDDGIRSFVINEVIPSVNARINYWLQFLMDGQIRVDFDSSLSETIRRIPEDESEFVYNSLSGGEHSRIDLAISQAFAHIMMVGSGACPSVLILDEICSNIDRPGIGRIYSMICELSKDRQVFVITHDPDLMDLLSDYETINVVKKNGITTIEQ